jgi:hypothetical protein
LQQAFQKFEKKLSQMTSYLDQLSNLTVPEEEIKEHK